MGSGVFNNMVIAAISIICIPAGQVRRIENIPVFIVTVFFSLFAYVWLLIILTAITPQKVSSSFHSSDSLISALLHYKVDVWEAVVTLLFLPLLAVASVLAEWLNNYLEAQPKSEVSL